MVRTKTSSLRIGGNLKLEVTHSRSRRPLGLPGSDRLLPTTADAIMAAVAGNGLVAQKAAPAPGPGSESPSESRRQWTRKA